MCGGCRERKTFSQGLYSFPLYVWGLMACIYLNKSARNKIKVILSTTNKISPKLPRTELYKKQFSSMPIPSSTDSLNLSSKTQSRHRIRAPQPSPATRSPQAHPCGSRGGHVEDGLTVGSCPDSRWLSWASMLDTMMAGRSIAWYE